MIDTKSLRIGNLVIFGGGDTAKVIAINPGNPDDAITLEGEDWTESFPEELINPIPITPEVLIACGFERNCSFFEKDNVQIMWGYTKEEGDFFHYTVDELVQYPHFKYIHQLQNLYYSLTGKELVYTTK